MTRSRDITAPIHNIRKESDKAFSRVLEDLAMGARDRDGNPALASLIELLVSAGPSDVNRRTLNRLAKLGLATEKSLSFKAQIVRMYDQHTVGFRNATWYLDRKNVAYRFADLLGVPRPETDLKTYRLSELPIEAGAVVKPASGSNSRGVYIVHSETTILALRDGLILQGVDALKKHASQSMAAGSGPSRDLWMLERIVYSNEATGTPARDVKVYCFYGKAEIVQTIDRTDGTRIAHWDMNGNLINPRTLDDKFLEGCSFPLEAVKLAQKLSVNIPHPFIRIDLLAGETGPVLGEFTPRPGTFHQFTPEWDAHLGRAWVQAEERLQSDMLQRKRYSSYLRATRFLKSQAPPKHPS